MFARLVEDGIVEVWHATQPTRRQAGASRANRARLRSGAPGIRLDLSDVAIRPATEQDIDPVLRLWEAAGSTPTVTDNHDGLRRLLATDGNALLVAESEEGVIGSLIAAWDGWRGSFYRLAVHPERRRQGIATALLREGGRRLRARGAARLTAIVAEDEPAAMELWAAVGYTRQQNRARFVSSDAPPCREHKAF